MFKLLKEEKALTLIELLFVLSILLMITSSLYSLLSSGEDVWNYGDKQITAQQNARSAMLRIVKEARNSYRLIDDSDYPTDGYNLSFEGIQVIGETLTTSDNMIYQSAYYPWISSAAPVVYKDGTILSSAEYNPPTPSLGQISFSSPQGASVIKADYTYSAKVTYTLQPLLTEPQGLLTRRVGLGSLENIAKYIMNKNQSPDPDVPVFTITDNLIEIKLIVDVDVNKKPIEYVLNSDIRLRK